MEQVVSHESLALLWMLLGRGRTPEALVACTVQMWCSSVDTGHDPCTREDLHKHPRACAIIWGGGHTITDSIRQQQLHCYYILMFRSVALLDCKIPSLCLICMMITTPPRPFEPFIQRWAVSMQGCAYRSWGRGEDSLYIANFTICWDPCILITAAEEIKSKSSSKSRGNPPEWAETMPSPTITKSVCISIQ